MIISETIAGVRSEVGRWRASGERIAVVPTMGNLHPGHIALVSRARELADRVVATIFVNPLQFSPNEDLENYPSTPQEDRAQLLAAGCDLLFAPGVEEVYPIDRKQVTRIEVPLLSELHCGASRPGHFQGVATIVAKLFHITTPDVALFGEKDYQQLTILRRMVEDLAMNIEMVGVATLREPDGVAMSSRNGYLTSTERQSAPALYQALTATAQRLRGGRDDLRTLEEEAKASLNRHGLRPDYFTICRRSDLREAQASDTELVILAAAYLGKARLIDNLLLNRDRSSQ